MPWKEGQPSLMGFLGTTAITKVTETRLFGGRYLRLLNFLGLLSYLYESGAILGRAICNKLRILTKMLVVPGAEIDKFIKISGDAAKERLDTFRNEVGNEPDTFNEFILLRALERLTGPSPDLKALKKVFSQKVPLEKAWIDIQTFGVEGIAFGSSFPELTEKMYRNSYESPDVDKWSKARAYGLDIPEKPEIISLEEQEEVILQMVTAYASEYYPELLDPLDLRGHLKE